MNWNASRLLVLCLIGCSGGGASPPASPAPVERSSEASSPVEASGDSKTTEASSTDDNAAGVADCAPSGAILLTHTSKALPKREGAVEALTIHDSGFWASARGESKRSGCLTVDELERVQKQLSSAEIAAPGLKPGAMRCMAMPTAEVTVTVGEQSATWTWPCGDPGGPSESLAVVVETILELTAP